MTKTNITFEVDLVYLWVDGNDPIWIEQKDSMLAKVNNPLNELKGRYENNDELKYSLRSIEKHAPWIRNIFIVTDNQTPEWLDTTNPKIKIIDHTEIMPLKSLPCYNSSVIEYFIYKIPGLSEHFIFANDDMFLNKDITPSFFFNNDGLPIVRLRFRLFHNLEDLFKRISGRNISNYKRGVNNAAKIIAKKLKRRYIGMTHHNIDAYLKSDFKHIVENEYNQELSTILENHFRSPNDIQRILISFHILSTKKGHLDYVNKYESLRIQAHKPDYEALIKKYNPKLFCINDNEHSSNEDRSRIKPFLDTLFPEKSDFEK